jgi:hypothetical protein
MGIKFKDILGAVTDFIPLKGLAKLAGKGAVALLGKKVAKVVGIDEKTVDNVFIEANKIVEQDHELKKLLIEESKAIRKHELDFFGSFAQLDLKTQKMRARMRPLLSLTMVGMFALYGLCFLFQQLFPYVLGMEFMIEFPAELVSITKVIIMFWFGGRTLEKVVDTIRNGKK